MTELKELKASESGSESRILRLRNLDGDMNLRELLDFLWDGVELRGQEMEIFIVGKSD